ncbi:MAG: hypothetical protein ABGY75_21990 [Gemmataceae bacterium]
MSTVYCPKCHTLRTDRTGHCRACGHWRMSTAAYNTVGTLVLSALSGATFTAAYGVCVFLIWDKWVAKFGGDVKHDPNAESSAFQLAVVIGSVVFTMTALMTLVLLRPVRTGEVSDQPA